MKAERHKLARQAGGGFWLSAPKPFNKIGITMRTIKLDVGREDYFESLEDIIDNMTHGKEQVINKLGELITGIEEQSNEGYQIEDLNSWHWADMEEAVIAYDIGYVNGCKNAIKIINEQIAQVETDYKTEIFTDKEPSLETLQGVVGGYIQVVVSKDGKADIVMDEDGKNKGKGVNYLATEMWQGRDRNQWKDVIVGDVAICMKKARLK